MTRRGSELAGKRLVVVNWRDLDHRQAGGAEIYAWQFARALRDAGADVRFLTARDAGQSVREVRDGIAVVRGGGRTGFIPFALGWLLRHRGDVDAVIDPSCGLPSFSPLVLRRTTPVLLVVHHVHQAQFTAHLPAPAAALARWLERVLMRRVYRRRAVAAVSESTAAEMRGQLGWTGDIRILANGADLPSYDAARALAKDADRIAVLGRLVTHKRVDLALEAVAAVLRRPDLAGRDLRVDVIGHGPDLARLAARAAELGVAGRVTFHGYLTEAGKHAVLGRAAVHVCASDAEGWGQAVIDAAARGVPTIARDVPGLRDSILPGESGWLVPDDPEHRVVVDRLAAALGDALVTTVDPDTRVRRADACLAWAARFDWSRMRQDARDLTTEMFHHKLTDGATSSGLHHPRDARVAV